MSSDPFVFIKSFDERLEYFNAVFNNSYKTSEVKAVWVSYIELMDTQLQAIWKVSREFCSDHEICYPCTVLVRMENVNAADLSCSVSVVGVQDDSIHFPEKVNDVPLIELHPTNDQDEDASEFLDSLRFFYNHLWMPWESTDIDFEDESSWVQCHLKGRLELYYSMVERSIPLKMAYSVDKLKFEACSVVKQLRELQESAMPGVYVEEIAPGQALKMMQLYNRLRCLRDQYHIYESPVFLKALVESKNNEEKLKPEPNFYLVLSVASVEQLKQYCQLLRSQTSDNETMGIVQTPQDALWKSCSGKRVFISAGLHHFFDSSDQIYALETSGTIKGLEAGVVLTGSCCFIVNKERLSISSLTLRLTDNITVIKVQPESECRLEDVTLEGCLAVDGVDVYPNASFAAVNCHFNKFHTPVTCHSQSTVSLTNCTFTDNKVALELKGDVNFTMENCTFSGSTMYAILVTVPRPHLSDCTTGISINSVPNMKEANTVFIGNKEDLHFETSQFNMGEQDIPIK